MNTYAYVINYPTRFADPIGLTPLQNLIDSITEEIGYLRDGLPIILDKATKEAQLRAIQAAKHARTLLISVIQDPPSPWNRFNRPIGLPMLYSSGWQLDWLSYETDPFRYMTEHGRPPMI